MKQPPKRLWIGDDQDGFWQVIEYENWPLFCGYCQLFGHGDTECFRKHPELKLVRAPGGVNKLHEKAKQVFLPKIQVGQTSG